jgi:hypothetical protein
VFAKARSSRIADKERLSVVLVVLLFVSLATVYSLVTPIFEGYDEHWHYAYVQYIASGKGLPRQPPDQYGHLARQEASQPPLYYLLASAVSWWVPSGDLENLLRMNPQFAPVPWGYRDNQNIIVHTDAERFPYRGTVLAVHLSRMISVLLGAGTVLCTYALARLLFPNQRALAFGAMIVTALTPGFLFASAVVNNDILATFLSSLALVLLVKIRKEGSRAAGVWLGIVLGCAALSKLSGLLLWPFAGLVLVVSAWRRRDWRWLARVGLPALALAVLVSSWWYVRNWVLYHDITGLNRMLDIVGRREPGFGLRDAWAEMEGVRRSYWALFGWFNVPVATWLYRVYDLISLLGLAGLAVYAMQAIRHRRWNDIAAVVFLSVWLAVSISGLLRWTLLTTGSQGRLLYPAISAIAILLVLGWLNLAPNREPVRGSAVIGIGLAFLAVAVYVPFFVIRPAYARPALLQPEQVARHISVESRVHFEDKVTLLGYQVDRQEVKPGDVLWVTLCWRGDRKLETDYSLFVQLLVDNDLIAAQKDTYHGLGSFPTSLWPAGVVFCEPYPLRVADTVPAPSAGILSIGLYRPSGERLLAYTEDGQPIGDNVRFPGPAVVFPEGGRTLNYDFGHKIVLVDYSLDGTAVTPGDTLSLTLSWRATEPMSTDYAATVQILDEQGAKIGQSDINLVTSAWKRGTTVGDQRRITISEDAPAGVYHIKVAVYEPVTVRNLLVYRNGQALSSGGLLDLWTLRVLPQPSQAQGSLWSLTSEGRRGTP